MKNTYLERLSDEQIYDQALQIFNYSSNFLASDKFNMASLLYNCSNILKTHVDEQFQKSLKNSLECIINPSCYRDKLNDLKSGNNSSFILAPLASFDHIFVSVIYKKDDSFECIVVNKGYSESSHPYEKYTISSSKFRNVIDCLGYYRKTNLSVNDIYQIFSQNSDSHDTLYNITSNPQKEGNCFFEELEAGLKYAYSNVYIKDFKTPKWPISTMSMHRKLVSNIKNDCPSLASEIDKIETVYVKNKQFRIYCKVLTDLNFEEKAKMFMSTFAHNETATLPDMLKYLDLQTITQNAQFLTQLCNTFNMPTLAITSTTILNPPVDNIWEYTDILNFVKETFPYAYKQLELNYSSSLTATGDQILINDANFSGALDAYNLALYFNPNNASAYTKRAICFGQLNKLDTAVYDFEYSLKLAPNDIGIRFIYANFLYEHKNLKAALSQCDIVTCSHHL